MQQTHNEGLDKFELHLNEMIVKVQDCQNSKNLKSCSECQDFLDCKLRDEYIKAVYNSMSKGDTGGFDF